MERITQRERQILEILRREPMLSQEGLARRLNISRSATAVHVSNLIKKGYILGRGYVFNDSGGIAVVGSSALSITGKQMGNDFKNEEVINIKWEGTAIKLGTKLSRLGLPTTVLTAVGRDDYGDEIVETLQKAGVDVLHIARSSKFSSAKRIHLQLRDGSCVNLADNNVDSLIGKDYLETKEEVLRQAPVIVIGGEVGIESIRFLMTVAERFGNRVCLLPGILNTIKEEEINFMGQTVVVTTGEEHGKFDFDNALKEFQSLNQKGLKGMVAVLGNQELAIFTPEDKELVVLSPAQHFDFGLTYFIAGLVYGWLKGSPLRQAARMGLSVSSRNHLKSESL